MESPDDKTKNHFINHFAKPANICFFASKTDT